MNTSVWYPSDCPILESVFSDLAPDAEDIRDVVCEGMSSSDRWWYFLPLSYQELAEWTDEILGRFSDHTVHYRKADSEIAVHAAGHNSVAFFGGGDDGEAEALAYAKFLRAVGYAVWTCTVEEFDACARMGVL